MSKRESEWETLCRLLEESDAKVTFSINCHSGNASFLGAGAVCGCWRCRESRGEPWDEDTEREAAARSKEASRLMREFATKGTR